MFSNPINFYKISIYISILMLLSALSLILVSNWILGGKLMVCCLFFLGIGFSGFDNLRGFTYTIMIFAAIILSLLYPQFFVEVNGFALSALTVPLIQIIMFGMGTSMSLGDFLGVMKMPKGVLIGVLCQFSIMPFIGFSLAFVSSFPAEISAGIILIGCSPSGMASNVMSYLAKANLALSITITSLTTILAPFITPYLMGVLAGEFIEIDMIAMMWDIIKMVIIPIGGGLLFNHFLRGKANWLKKVMPLVSMVAIGLIIVVITAAGRDSLLSIGPILILLVLIHNLTGYTLGYWAGRLCKLNEQDCRTIAIEVGMQNGGLASGIAKGMGKIATVGLAPAVFGPLMNVTGSILASYWHRKPVTKR